LYSFSIVAFGGDPVEFSTPSETLTLPESLIPTDLTIPPSQPTDLAGNNSYSWFVVAFDTRVNFSQASDTIRLPDEGPVDTTIPPSTPVNLSGQLSSDDTVATISWDASTDDREVAGYNVYRDNHFQFQHRGLRF